MFSLQAVGPCSYRVCLHLMLQGEGDIEQLALVIRGLGTPNWRGITSLPDYNKISFPPSRPQPWETLLPDVEPVAVQIVSALIVYDPSCRLTAKQVSSC